MRPQLVAVMGGNPRRPAISREDGEFLLKAMKKMDVQKVRVERKGTRDLCVLLSNPPVITVGDKWAAAPQKERHKRLVHELLHVKGLSHGPRERAMGYYSNPDRDIFSKQVYDKLFGSKRKVR